MISESLKINTTLTELYLFSEDKIMKMKIEIGERELEKLIWTDNNIGAEGAKTISESLKINTTLTGLELGSDDKIMKMKCK